MTHAGGLDEPLEMFEVYPGLDLFAVLAGLGDCPVNRAYGNREPVRAGLSDKPSCLFDVGEAAPTGEQFLIRGHRPFLVSEDGAEFGLARDACFVGEVGHLVCARDVALEVKLRAVYHHRLIADGDGFLYDRKIVDPQVVLVDDGDVVQVQSDVLGVVPLCELVSHLRRPL